VLAATLSSGPYRWRGIALLPLRLGQPTYADGEPSKGEWQDVGDRLRDLRAVRGTYFRLDLSLAPLKSRGAAQLALTGDDQFFRIARMAAERQGLYLNEYGLWRWHAALEESHSKDAGYWELVEGESEARILDELALGNIPPARRNFRFLTDRTRASARAGTLDLDADPFPAKSDRLPKSHSESESPGGISSLCAGAPEDVQVVDGVWIGTTKNA